MSDPVVTFRDVMNPKGDEAEGAEERRLGVRVVSGWPALTEALRQPGSLLRAFLAERFPNTSEVYKRYRNEAGPLVVPASDEALSGGLAWWGARSIGWLVSRAS